MMRAFFLFLSRRKSLRRWMETSSVSRKFVKRFIAGLTLEEELAVCRQLNSEKILASLDRLGENVNSLDEAAASRNAYLEILERIADQKLQATVSVKLTQLGLDFGADACTENVRHLAAKARSIGSAIEIDMESSEYTGRTLEIVTAMHQEPGHVRAVVQAYLRRTASDVNRLCELGVPVRLCKGAYDEPHTVAFPTKREVDANYVRLMKYLFDHGRDPAIASHDELIVGEALRYIHERKIAPDRFEFQMLYGIRRDLQKRLVDRGYRPSGLLATFSLRRLGSTTSADFPRAWREGGTVLFCRWPTPPPRPGTTVSSAAAPTNSIPPTRAAAPAEDAPQYMTATRGCRSIQTTRADPRAATTLHGTGPHRFRRPRGKCAPEGSGRR